MNRFIKTAVLAIVGLGLAVIPAAAAQAAVPPGTITAVQASGPCGDSGAAVVVTIDDGAPNTQYGAEVLGVSADRVVTDANGDGSMWLSNVGLEDVTVHVSAANYNETRTFPVDIQCGTGHGKD